MDPGEDPIDPTSPPSVVFVDPDGVRHQIYPGDLIGRLASAALSIADPRISEAHALLSLRGSSFRLLGLRGGLRLGSRWRGELELREGMGVGLAEGYDLTVERIVVPTSILALDGLGPDPVALDRPEWSLLEDGPRAEPRVDRDASAWIWCAGGAWWLQRPDRPPRRIDAGDTLKLGPHTVSVIAAPVAAAATPGTVRSARSAPPMVLDIWPEHSEIRVGERQAVKITGNSHRILRQTALHTADGGSVHWTRVAEQIWRVNATEDNWFTNHRRLQHKLRQQRIPPDLVTCSNGQVHLAIRADVDRIEIHGSAPG